jgi:hypothetical protein
MIPDDDSFLSVILFIASWALFSERPARYTVAPALYRILQSSKPTPEFPPVTILSDERVKLAGRTASFRRNATLTRLCLFGWEDWPPSATVAVGRIART